MRYQQDTPVAPRFVVNAPNLYIPGMFLAPPCHLSPPVPPSLVTCVMCWPPPVMAFVTYILVASLALGTQNR